MISLIVAASQNRAIGRENRLPWHLPNDLRYFRRVTKGSPVIMGRKTFESIGWPLPGRQNIVVTRDKAYRAEGCEVVNSLEAAFLAAQQDREIFVIGGADLYRQALGLAGRIYLTEVHAEVEGDAFFPDPGPDWQEVSREHHPADLEHAHAFDWVVLERRT
ncbi:MAG: dihydrofolate reductase [Meiothermus sp.]|nr:dihydrofolate reductase [Meiothermus sp.]